MNAVQKIEAAIKRLLQVKSSLGFVMVGEDPTDLYVRVEEDDDYDGPFTFGLSVGGGADSDEEINEALALVAGTIDAQLAILRTVLLVSEYAGLGNEGERVTIIQNTIDLADAILGSD